MVNKLATLKNVLRELKNVVIAYSGGVDSTFLLKVACDTLGENVLAIIAKSPTYPESEARLAEEMCETLGVGRRVIQTDEFLDEKFVNNPIDRCYHCKKELFTKIAAMAAGRPILDGSNLDDLSDFRPGSKAKTEAKVRSPLQEVGLTKQEIRQLSKELGLPTWDKPSLACLASRIPYGTRITQEILTKIGAGEDYLRSLGFKQSRVRHHGPIVRIEVEQSAINLILRDGIIMNKIVSKFEKIGYTYVTLDLKGYRTGSLNETHLS